MNAPIDGPRTRVVHIITLLELGGAQQNTLHTVQNLDRRRFKVALIAGCGGMLDDEARAIPDTDLQWVANLVREIAPIKDFLAAWRLVQLLRKQRPHIVHTHSSKAGILGRLAASLAGVPIIVHSIHGFGFTPGHSVPLRAAFLLAERLCAPLTTHFVVVARANLTEGVRKGLFRRADATLIRSGFALEQYRNAAVDRVGVRRELGFEPDCPLVATVACLKPQKDPMTWVASVARVAASEPSVRFFIAGDGELRRPVTARLDELGITSRVKLLGWRDDIPRLLAASDLLLHTSRWEGLPRVIPQAMSVGLPVVATAVDGAPEAVRGRATGLLCAPLDAIGLGDAVIELMRDPARRRRMGDYARELVAEFDQAHLAPAQERLYDRLCSAWRSM